MRKILLSFIALLGTVQAWGYDAEVDGIYYNLNVGTREAEVTDDDVTYGYYSGDVVIPASIDIKGVAYSVTSIESGAFYYCKDLTSVVIPNSVTSIGASAFYGCRSLTAIEIPNSVTSIDSYAFDDTAWYNSQSDGLVYLGKFAYRYKGTMPENTSIELEEGIKGIAGQAFYNCSGLTSVAIPNSVTNIGDAAFLACSGLTSITIDSSNPKYDSRNNCNAIIETSSNTLIAGCKNTIIPNSVTSIGTHAFYDCSGLTSISIPNSVTSIGTHAFYYCSGLTSISIPNSVTSIGEYNQEIKGKTNVEIIPVSA